MAEYLSESVTGNRPNSIEEHALKPINKIMSTYRKDLRRTQPVALAAADCCWRNCCRNYETHSIGTYKLESCAREELAFGLGTLKCKASVEVLDGRRHGSGTSGAAWDN